MTIYWKSILKIHRKSNKNRWKSIENQPQNPSSIVAIWWNFCVRLLHKSIQTKRKHSSQTNYNTSILGQTGNKLFSSLEKIKPPYNTIHCYLNKLIWVTNLRSVPSPCWYNYRNKIVQIYSNIDLKDLLYPIPKKKENTSYH